MEVDFFSNHPNETCAKKPTTTCCCTSSNVDASLTLRASLTRHKSPLGRKNQLKGNEERILNQRKNKSTSLPLAHTNTHSHSLLVPVATKWNGTNSVDLFMSMENNLFAGVLICSLLLEQTLPHYFYFLLFLWNFYLKKITKNVILLTWFIKISWKQETNEFEWFLQEFPFY